MGGTSLADGMTHSSIHPKNCDRLRCLDCHKKVVKFRENKWKEIVDYLFVRNHVTNLKELEKVNFCNLFHRVSNQHLGLMPTLVNANSKQ